ncbi:hypothetical protein M885DRAFT_90007 [Pelagophyceae sp. CCMP2097]|nr:hypothetical protein M885DRAFT_90007 [Pelagophyceae sp. CCMP2097]
MGASASASFAPMLHEEACKPSDGSDLRDYASALDEAVRLRRTLAAIRSEVSANRPGAAFEHCGPDGVWRGYSPQQNVLLAVAQSRDPDGSVDLPGMPLQVRFGAAATSIVLPRQPDTGMIQVHSDGSARVVRCNVESCRTFSFRRPDGVWHRLAPDQCAAIATNIAHSPHAGSIVVAGTPFEVSWNHGAVYNGQLAETGLVVRNLQTDTVSVARGEWGAYLGPAAPPAPMGQQPVYYAQRPGYSPMQPNYQPMMPGPGYQPMQPGYAPTQPGYAPTQPGYQQTQPGYTPAMMMQPGYAPQYQHQPPIMQQQQQQQQQPMQYQHQQPQQQQRQAQTKQATSDRRYNTGALAGGAVLATGVGAVGALAISNPHATASVVTGGAHDAAQWAGTAGVTGAAADAARWSGGAAGDASQWISGTAMPALGHAAGDASQWVTGAAMPTLGHAAGDAAQWGGGAASALGHVGGDVADGAAGAAQGAVEFFREASNLFSSIF